LTQLPTHEEVSEALAAGAATALHRFIHDNEPAGPSEVEFRAGLAAVIAEASAELSPATEQSGEAAGLSQVDMGLGQFAVGGCCHPETRVPGIVYLHLRDARPLGSDTTDVYPVGSEAQPHDIAGLVYFHNELALQQTIEVLQELQRDNYGKPAPVVQYIVVIGEAEYTVPKAVHDEIVNLRHDAAGWKKLADIR
ncbi:hypothetical protein ACPRNU_25670, partial [Chromobacterium vaccinii]|uniref:hypothetical protein n=1 Tax=Chromobacterium vaccinii TaxID=1108595 RepID=UPI003C743F3B